MGSSYSFWDSPDQEVTDFPRAIEIDHHSGPRVIPIVEGQSYRETVYRYILITHDWLAEGNHIWFHDVAEDAKPWEHLSVAIYYGNEEFQPFFGPPVKRGDYWFRESFRIVSPEVFDRDIAHQEPRIARYRDELAQCRDTIRGRKRASKLRDSIKSAECTQRYYARRKQELLDGKFWHPTPKISEAELKELREAIVIPKALKQALGMA